MQQDRTTPPGGPKSFATRAGGLSGRGLRFLAGLLLGLLLIPLMIGGGFALLAGAALTAELVRPPPAKMSSSHVSEGADISRAGGVAVVWRRQHELTRQACRGVCDDLTFRGGAAEAVEVRDAAGRCLVCREPSWPARVFLRRRPEGSMLRPQLTRKPEAQP